MMFINIETKSLVWVGLFNGIPTPYELFNAKI